LTTFAAGRAFEEGGGIGEAKIGPLKATHSVMNATQRKSMLHLLVPPAGSEFRCQLGLLLQQQAACRSAPGIAPGVVSALNSWTRSEVSPHRDPQQEA
jgi:hypothetical protein